MKKLLSFVVLGLITASVLVGCKPKEEETVPPVTTNSVPSTNAVP